MAKNRAGMIKIATIALAVSFFVQVLTSVGMVFLRDLALKAGIFHALVEIHEYNGFIFVGLVLAHIYFNWWWVKANILKVVIIVLLMSGTSYAAVIKGTIDKIDIKSYTITVGGKQVDISKATMFTQNDRNIAKNVVIGDIKDHSGEKAYCYGSFDKDNVFIAYKVKIVEGHK